MPLSPGTRLGPYEIQSAIGAGGMGEVYGAIDTNLGRRVAIKVSPEAFSEDKERLARFEREAKTLAALNHPHIAQIYGLEKSGGVQALVMELVEGDDLSQRIARGPIPQDDALPLARQIAAALEAAHEQGIIHRDLKPANIKVRPDGTVKVLDFGLAKAMSPAEDGRSVRLQPDLSMSPTITSPAMMTGVGVLLGTAAYMAPEQARGKAIDKRADIWAFGCVLFEMLTGERLFKGDDLTETLASVIKEQPDISKAPLQVHRLLKRCLEKDPGKRLRDIGDAWDLLTAEPSTIANARTYTPWLPWAVAAAFGVAAAGIASVHFRETAGALPALVRFQIPVVEEAGAPNPAIAPDGTRIVYQAGNQLWVRDLDSLSVRQLPGTDGTINQPFWSYDSKFVVFASAGSLKKIDVSGGPPQTLCALPGLLRGGFWTSDGRIVFALADGRLLEVPSSGGASSALNITGGAGAVSLHSGALPDGQHFVYAVRAGPDESQGIYVTSINDGVPKKVLPDRSDVSYVPPHNGSAGHLLFVRAGTLMAQQFDAASLELSGDAISLHEQVQNFSASESGSLVYRAGADARRLTWYDRRGTATGTAWAPGPYVELALSPDDSRVVLVRADNPPATWIHEFAREASVRVAFKGVGVKPIWSPDGTQIIVVSSEGNGQAGIVRNVANGAGHEETLLTSTVGLYPLHFSGRWLLYTNIDAKTKEDLWLLPMEGERKPEPFLATDYVETDGVFSPDGRFIAYVSDESGRFEVYVRSFPASVGGKWVVSNGGGYQPRWRHDGRELFYFSTDGRLMSVDVAATATFQASAPHFLFQVPIFGGGASTSNHYWDVTADGQRFLINTVSAESGASVVTVVLNWQEALKRRTPAN